MSSKLRVVNRDGTKSLVSPEAVSAQYPIYHRIAADRHIVLPEGSFYYLKGVALTIDGLLTIDGDAQVSIDA